MKKYFEDKENIIVTVFFVITIIIACNPLISRYCIQGHDIDYHLLRIEALKEGIITGHPFAKVNSLFFGGAGYASSMFYSDFLLYIPAILRAIGVSIGASYHIFVAVCIILCYLASYYCGYGITKSKYAGIAAAVMVTLCPYHIDDVLIRAAAGEYVAFIFVPLAIYGIYNVLYEDMSKPYVFALGFGGLILSHPATLVMVTAFCAVAFLIKIKKFLGSINLLFKLILTSLITVCLTSFYWLPMLEQFAAAQFYVSDNWTDMLYSAVDLSQIFSNDFPTMGFVLILIAVLRVFVSKKDDRRLDYADWMLVAGVVFMIGATNLLPWDKLARFLSFVQFPWRLFIVSSVLFAIADAIIINALCDKLRDQSIGAVIMPALVFTIFCVMTYMGLMHYSENAQGYYDYSNDYYSYKPYTANVIAGEWLPKSVTKAHELVDMSEHMYADDGTELPFVRSKGVITAEINEEYAYVDVPFVFYKGYSAKIIGENGGQGISVLIDGSGENGLCRVYPDDDMRGTLIVEYTGTKIQKVSYILSIIALLLSVFLLIRGKKKIVDGIGKTAGVVAVLCIVLSCSLCGCQSTNTSAKADSAVKADTQYDISDPDDLMRILEGRGKSLANDVLNGSEFEQDEVNGEYNEEPIEDIRICSIGYVPRASKQAVVVCTEPIYADEGMTFVIVDSTEDKAVYADSAGIYERDGQSYAVCDFTKWETPGEYYLVTDKGARSEAFLLSDNAYEETCKGILANESGLSLIEAGDLLLAKRLGQEDKELAEALTAITDRLTDSLEYDEAGELIFSAENHSLSDMFMTAAILACTGADQVAEDVYKAAENVYEALPEDYPQNTENSSFEGAAGDDSDVLHSRFWAGCELYAATQSSKYEDAVDGEEISEDVRNNPSDSRILYGIVAYMSSQGRTDKKLSENMITALLNRANNLIGINMFDDGDVLSDPDIAAEYARLLMTANYISPSAEYRNMAQECINIAYGCTPCDTVTDMNSMYFAISGL